MEQKQVTERIAVVESRLDQHDVRLNKHSERLDVLNEKNIKQDSELTQLKLEMAENTEMTKKNHDLLQEICTKTNTAGWMLKVVVYGVPALLSLWFAIKQLGVF